MTGNNNIQAAADEFHRQSLLPPTTQITFEQLKEYLTIHINQLLKNDFAALVQLLYRLDIPEEKLRWYLQQNKGELAAGIIAELMIERQLQKIEARRSFKINNTISDEEKW